MKKLLIIMLSLLFVMNVYAKEEVKSLAIDGSGIKPVAGGTPKYLNKDGHNYSIQHQSWVLAKSGTPVSTFEEGFVYEYSCLLRAEPYEQYTFSADAVVNITGVEWNAQVYETDSDGYISYYATYTVPESTAKTVKIYCEAYPEYGGTVPDSIEVKVGQGVWITAKPNEGYDFDGWQWHGEYISHDNPYQVFPTDDMKLVAVFGKSSSSYKITCEMNPKDAGSIEWSNMDIMAGAEFTNEAIPAAHYTFKSWTMGGTVITKDPVLKYKADGNYHFVANFEKEKHTLKIEATEGGTVSAKSVTAYYDEKGYVEAFPQPGYHFKHFTENGTVISTYQHSEFSMTKDRTIVCVFEKDAPTTYEVTIKESPGGTVTGTSGTVTAGSTAQFSQKADKGYYFAGWYKDGEKVSDEEKYSFKVEKNTAVAASFKKYSVGMVILNNGNSVSITDKETLIPVEFTKVIDEKATTITVELTPESGLSFNTSPDNLNITIGGKVVEYSDLVFQDNILSFTIKDVSAYRGQTLKVSLMAHGSDFSEDRTSAVNGLVKVDGETFNAQSNAVKIVKQSGSDPAPKPDKDPAKSNLLTYGLIGVIVLLLLVIILLLVKRKREAE